MPNIPQPPPPNTRANSAAATERRNMNSVKLFEWVQFGVAP
jgi:hypothetical protein